MVCTTSPGAYPASLTMNLGTPMHKRGLAQARGDADEAASESARKSPRTAEEKEENEDMEDAAAEAKDRKGGGRGRKLPANLAASSAQPAARGQRGKEAKLQEAMQRMNLASAELTLKTKMDQRESNWYSEKSILVPTCASSGGSLGRGSRF